MNFECERIEEFDAAGLPTVTGANWCEGRPLLEMLVNGAGWAFLASGIGAGVYTGLSLLLTYSVLVSAFLTVTLVAAGMLAFEFGKGIGGTRRALYFHRNGQIEAPLGLQGGSKGGILRTALSDVANIEAAAIERNPDEGGGYTHGVRLILRNGTRPYVAQFLEPDDAAHLSILLMTALVQCRGGMTSVAYQTRDASVLIE